MQTAQYWLWFMSLYPLTLINSEMSTIHGVSFFVLFIYGQCSWGYFANAFENEGQDTIPGIQYANYQFFVINLFLMLVWLKH